MKSNILYPEGSRKFLLSCALILTCFFSNATIKTVQVSNFAFTPANITATVGDTILWTWVSGTHTTTSATIPNGATAWNSPMTSTNTTFQYVVTLTGLYNYYCQMHPTIMLGSITVSGAAAVNEPFAAKAASVYPNPSQGRFRVASPKTIQQIEIYDILGNIVYAAPINAEIAAVDLSSHANGIYFVHLLFDDNTAVEIKRIIIGN